MPFLLAYWKEAALFALMGVVFYLGYHLHTLQDKAAENADLRLQIEKANTATVNVAKFDRDYTREISHAQKTDCINQPMPAGIVKLLREQ